MLKYRILFLASFLFVATYFFTLYASNVYARIGVGVTTGKIQVDEILRPGTIYELPPRVEPGDYFAFLEGSPTKRVNKGGAVVGVAAAAKLYFTVEPANILSAVYYKTLSFWKVYDPWPKVLLTVGIVLYVIYLFRKRFNIQISSKKSIHKDTESHE